MDWHLLLALGGILGVEAVIYIVLQAIAFTLTNEHGEVINRERPVTINVSLICLFFITTLKFPLQIVECMVLNLLL